MKIAIIGGYGKMGRWFADFLLKDDKEVVIAGPNREKLLEVKRQLGVEITTDNAEAVEGADVVFSDNYFDLPAKRTTTVALPAIEGWSLDRVRKALRIRSLVDSF